MTTQDKKDNVKEDKKVETTDVDAETNTAKDDDKEKKEKKDDGAEDKESSKNNSSGDDITDDDGSSVDSTDSDSSNSSSSGSGDTGGVDDGSDSDNADSVDSDVGGDGDSVVADSSQEVSEDTPEAEARKIVKVAEAEKALGIRASLESLADHMDSIPNMSKGGQFMAYQTIKASLAGTGASPSRVFPCLLSYETKGEFLLTSKDLRNCINNIDAAYGSKD